MKINPCRSLMQAYTKMFSYIVTLLIQVGKGLWGGKVFEEKMGSYMNLEIIVHAKKPTYGEGLWGFFYI